MKLTYNSQTDHKEIKALTRLILLSQKGKIFSGMSARQFCNQVYGIDIDHHEWAYRLDEMTRTGEATYHAYNGGDTQYIIN